jgi:hypothetical protein
VRTHLRITAVERPRRPVFWRERGSPVGLIFLLGLILLAAGLILVFVFQRRKSALADVSRGPLRRAGGGAVSPATGSPAPSDHTQ